MDPGELVDCTPDERLLEEDAANLPAAVGRPEPPPEASATRKRIVGVGATLTGVTLLGGVALVIAGLVGIVASGFGALAVVALIIGLVLASTHWGWVHVAEVTATGLEGRRTGSWLDRQRGWLDAIKPYPRYEVTTSVEDDGAIRIVRLRYEPVVCGEHRFTFKPAIAEHEEVHSADEPGATVAERAELLRRQAAADTERERERFEAVADAYETALMSADDEQQRQAARHAASRALSEQINANLREPPLIE